MKRIEFKINWHEPFQTDNADERSVTWAQLSIGAGDDFEWHKISQHFNSRSESSDDRLYISLYSLAEWMAVNWWNILYEPFASEKLLLNSDDFFSRHNLKYARSGFSLPDLKIHPQGESVKLIWDAAELKNHNCQFLNSGRIYLRTDVLKNNVSTFIESVIIRLEKFGIRNTLLQEEWTAIVEAYPEEEIFCVSAAEAGLDPYNLSDEQQQLIIKASKSLPSVILKEFYSATNGLTIEEDISITKTAIDLVDSSEKQHDYIKNIKSELPKNQLSSPSKKGYEAARAVRKALNLNGKAITSLSDFEGAINIELSDLLVSLDSEVSSSIKLLGGKNRTDSPLLIVTKDTNSIQSKKFSIARGLYEYLYGEKYSIISDVDLYSQKVNRAFAAEFLLPAETLSKRIKTEYVSAYQIEDLAEEFQISHMVVEHQIYNHRIAKRITHFD